MRCLGYDKGEITNYHPVVYGPTHYFPDYWSLQNTFLWIRLLASCNTIFSIQIVNEKKWQNTSFPKLLLPCYRDLEKSKFISKHCTQTPLSLKLIFKHPSPPTKPFSNFNTTSNDEIYPKPIMQPKELMANTPWLPKSPQPHGLNPLTSRHPWIAN